MRVINDVCYSKSGHPQQYLDIYLPERESFKVVIYIHGGGLLEGDKSTKNIVGEYLAKKGIAFVSVNYRLYPQAVYPEFIRDAAEAVAWVYNNISEYGYCEGLYIGGSSAGGYISMMLCFNKIYLSPYDIPENMIKGYIHDAGQPTAHFNVLEERGIDSRKVIIDETAPLFYVGDADYYPPMIVIVSDNDMENRYEQTQLLLSTLRHFGYDEKKIFYKLMHGEHCYYSKTEELGEIIYEFIKEVEK